MKIMLVNDDSINAQGIKELAAALAPHCEVYVCAPATQQSASGHGISMNTNLYVEPREFANAAEAYAINGSPADCTKLGLYYLKEKCINIDAVFSGINHGGNLGYDTLYSGTVSAAIEANLCGLPSAAISVNGHEPVDFSYACSLAVKVLLFMQKGMEAAKAQGREYELQHNTINVNVPNVPAAQVKGVKLAPLGPREYDGWFKKSVDKDGKEYYGYTGIPVVYDSITPTPDVIYMQDGYATITPLYHDFTDGHALTKLGGILE